MNPVQTAKPPKGQMKCNACRTNCQIKNGDWFFSTNSTSQQVFLCKSCESKGKGMYKKVSVTRPESHR